MNVWLLCEVIDGPDGSIPIERARFVEKTGALAALNAKSEEYEREGYSIRFHGECDFTALRHQPWSWAEWSCGEAGPSYAFVDDGKKTPFDDDAEWVEVDPFAEPEVTLCK